MSEKPEAGNALPEREPMPESWKPVWRFMGWIALLIVSIGAVSAGIAWIVKEAAA